MGIESTGHDHLSVVYSLRPDIINCGYSDAYVYYGNYSPSTLDAILDSDENNMFVIRCHGGPLPNASGTCILIGGTNVTYDSLGSINTLDLTNMKLIMFIGCQTAVGGDGGLNLPTVAVDRGAATAIGFSGNINCVEANNWTLDFFEYLYAGYSVFEACEELSDSDEYEDTLMTSVEICGNISTRIN